MAITANRIPGFSGFDTSSGTLALIVVLSSSVTGPASYSGSLFAHSPDYGSFLNCESLFYGFADEPTIP